MLGTTLAFCHFVIFIPPLGRLPIVVSTVSCVFGFSDPKVTKFITDFSPLIRFNLFAHDFVMHVL